MSLDSMSPSEEEILVLSDVDAAGLVVSRRIIHEVASQLDLKEALENSSHPYSTRPTGWPPFVEVIDTRDLPKVLVERAKCSDGNCTFLCGLFPNIRRAWASINNSIFLWPFDKRDGKCEEFYVGKEAICAVGFTKLRPAFFPEAIQGLLILATPVELNLVTVCCSGSGDADDPYSGISLHHLVEYTVPSDGVTMTCITCTQKGRIFMAGEDGHIYELNYTNSTTGSGRHKCCRKICLTARVGNEIFRFFAPNLYRYKFGAVDPIIEMVVDDERQILYARTEGMKLQVYTMGLSGDGQLKKVAEERNLLSQKDAHYGGGQTEEGRTSNQLPKLTIVSISPLTTLESKLLHLLVVLSDGRRMYLSTSSVGELEGYNVNFHRPNCLRVVTTRPAPSLGSSGGFASGAISLGTRSQTEDLSLKVISACYTVGTLVLNSSPSTTSTLIIASRDFSSHSTSSSTLGTPWSSRALRELISSFSIKGEMLCAADVRPDPDIAATVISLYSELDHSELELSGKSGEKECIKLWAKGDIYMPHILSRQKLVVFSTGRISLVAFNRPVDILIRLFESDAPRALLKDFFDHFGADEAAALCLMLAAGIVHSDNPINDTVPGKAAAAFEDPELVGMPQGSSGLSNIGTSAGEFSLGQAVQEAEPLRFGANEGLSLCSCRLLLPIWELPVYVIKGRFDASAETGVVGCRLSVKAMKVLESKLRSLEKFLRSRRNQRRGLYGSVEGSGDMTGSFLRGTSSELGAGDRRTADSKGGETSNERQRLADSPAEKDAMKEMERFRQLFLRSAEALYLLQFLSEPHVACLVQNVDTNVHQSLLWLTFSRLVCSEKGHDIVISLYSSLIAACSKCNDWRIVDNKSSRLGDGCPTYFDKSRFKGFLALKYLEEADVAPDQQEKNKMAKKGD